MWLKAGKTGRDGGRDESSGAEACECSVNLTLHTCTQILMLRMLGKQKILNASRRKDKPPINGPSQRSGSGQATGNVT